MYKRLFEEAKPMSVKSMEIHASRVMLVQTRYPWLLGLLSLHKGEVKAFVRHNEGM